jgi:hypothetical protein
MPSLQNISVEYTNVNVSPPLIFPTGELKFNNTTVISGTIVRQTVSSIPLYYDINIPVGAFGLGLNRKRFDILVDPSSSAIAMVGRLFKGNGINTAINVMYPNAQSSVDYTCQLGGGSINIIFVYGVKLKHSAIGF